MALNRTGRILYIDAPATHAAIFAAGESVRISAARLVGGSDAATLTIYADPTNTAGTEIGILKTAAANEVDDLFPASSEDVVPDSRNGLTVVLSGTSAKAFIWLS